MSSNNTNSFASFSLPLIRKSYPKLIADKLVGVQPMAKSSSTIFHVLWKKKIPAAVEAAIKAELEKLNLKVYQSHTSLPWTVFIPIAVRANSVSRAVNIALAPQGIIISLANNQQPEIVSPAGPTITAIQGHVQYNLDIIQSRLRTDIEHAIYTTILGWNDNGQLAFKDIGDNGISVHVLRHQIGTISISGDYLHVANTTIHLSNPELFDKLLTALIELVKAFSPKTRGIVKRLQARMGP